jgi:hypothetical protein
MKRKLMSIFSDNGFIKGLAGSFANKHVRNAGIVAAVFLLACGPMVTSLEFKAVAHGFTHSLQEQFMFLPVPFTQAKLTKTSLLPTLSLTSK